MTKTNLLKRIFWLAVAVLVILYGGDYVLLQLKTFKGQAVKDTVQVQRYYAIAEKNNKVEFAYDDNPSTEECVLALFPHFGDNPCWYVRRHKEQRVDE